MKELLIEEKAKRYDEAIKRANSLLSSNELGNAWIYKLLPELKKSEDERIADEIIQFLYLPHPQFVGKRDHEEWIAWLKKQSGQHPKFKKGDTIKKKSTGDVVTISEIDLKNREYRLSNTGFIPFKHEHLWELVEQKTADKIKPKFKVGDWVAYPYGSITLFKYLDENLYMAHVLWVDGHIELNNSCVVYNVHPASKEQRDLLFQKMRELGYEWDFENKKLEEELPKGEDYGIDGLYHAIRILEKTLGKVDGYQTDDGILEHQCAISAVKELSKKKLIE